MMDNSSNESKKNNEKVKPDADLVIPDINIDPSGKHVYHSLIGKSALWGGLIGGFFFAALFWLVAAGYIPITGLGQLSSAEYSAAAFLGFVTGIALGGLLGSILGLSYMLKLDSKDKNSPT